MSGKTEAAIGQVQRTEGVADTLNRPGPFNRALMAFVAWAERLNLRCSKVGNPPVYDNATFPWAAEIEGEWRADPRRARARADAQGRASRLSRDRRRA